MSFINALPGAIAQGMIWGIMAIGVYITFRILDVADLTVDGSIVTGACVAAIMVYNGANIWLAMLCAFLAGLVAGLVTGVFHTFMGIPAILAGILTQLILWSVNLKILGKPNLGISAREFNVAVTQLYKGRGGNSLRRDTRFAVLVFRNGARSFAQSDGVQPPHEPCSGHQHEYVQNSRAYAV